MRARHQVGWCIAATVAALLVARGAMASPSERLILRGRPQVLHLSGPPGGDPVIVSSGDGGWMHLAPHVAALLAARGFFVVGFDVKSYLESFTSSTTTLRIEDEPGDYRALAEYAAQRTGKKPTLIGVSEGGGLSVLAATDARTKAAIAGVVGVGLPDLNELAWRWKDSVIYLTHGVPNEPTFSAAAIIGKVAPVPLAVIASTRDDFVPLTMAQHLLDAAAPPKNLWVVQASDHQFSDNEAEFDRRLIEALAWVGRNGVH